MNNADKLTRPILKASKEQGNVISHEYEGGLTKREAFAMAAMQGILSNKEFRSDIKKSIDSNELTIGYAETVSIMALEMANHMLKELEETQ